MLYPEESNRLMGLAIQLHSELGRGFKEKVYQDAFEVLLPHDFYYDFLCYGKIGVEIKTFPEITGEFESQLINYLHVGHHKLGVIFDFGTTSLLYRWLVNKDLVYPNS